MTKEIKNNTSGWIALTFFTTLFIMTGVIVTFLMRDFKQFDTYHQQISYQTIYSVSYELGQFFENQQRLAQLVTSTYQEQINDWANDPNNEEKHKNVQQLISLFFPKHYSFTLGNEDGHAIWDDLGENIGEKCLTELYEYAHNTEQSINKKHHISSIHPGPSAYHYDLFIPINDSPQAKILLISFLQTDLIEMLANRQSVDHNLIVVNEKQSNLIELTGSGGRNTLSRPFNLLYDEEWLIYEGIGGKKEISNSDWSVVDMIDPDKRDIKHQEMTTGVMLAIITMLLLALIGDFSLSRYRQITDDREKMLRDANILLEQEVEKRTALLTEQKAQLKLAANVFEQSSEGILITDENNIIVNVNQALQHITGFSREELIGKDPKLLTKTKRSAEFYKNMWNSLQEYDCWHGELEDFNSKKHHRITMQCAISVVRDDQGKIVNYIAIYTNITPLKTAQRALENMAYYDRLTGLPNRALLFEHIEKGIVHNHLNNTLLAVCYMDLDGFKPVNDTLGHEAGDELLKLVAMRLENMLRPEDTVARLGGDEFVILINNLKEQSAVQPVLQRVMEQMQTPFIIQEHSVQIGASIGVSFYPQHGDNTDQLLRSADQAMYHTKRNGKNNIVYADDNLLS